MAFKGGIWGKDHFAFDGSNVRKQLFGAIVLASSHADAGLCALVAMLGPGAFVKDQGRDGINARKMW